MEGSLLQVVARHVTCSGLSIEAPFLGDAMHCCVSCFYGSVRVGAIWNASVRPRDEELVQPPLGGVPLVVVDGSQPNPPASFSDPTDQGAVFRPATRAELRCLGECQILVCGSIHREHNTKTKVCKPLANVSYADLLHCCLETLCTLL